MDNDTAILILFVVAGAVIVIRPWLSSYVIKITTKRINKSRQERGLKIHYRIDESDGGQNYWAKRKVFNTLIGLIGVICIIYLYLTRVA